MEVLYIIIPASVLLVGVVAWALVWAIRSDQYEDLEGPAWRVLMDDDAGRRQPAEPQESSETPEQREDS